MAEIATTRQLRRVTTNPYLRHADDLDPLEHPNRAGAAFVAWRDNAEWSLVVEERLSVDGVRNDDLAAGERGIDFGERKDDLIAVPGLWPGRATRR